MYWLDSRGRRWHFVCEHSWIDEDILALLVENMDQWQIQWTWWDWDVSYRSMSTYVQKKVFCRFDFCGERVVMETVIYEKKQSSE
jgi:hypothetical protein